MLATTHYMDEADHCNTIGMMDQGRLVALAGPEEIKDRLPGVLVRIDCDRSGEACERLQGLEGVVAVSVHGAQIHATVPDAGGVARVEQSLTAAGFVVRSAEIVQPSLEDAFLSMVMPRRSQAAGPALGDG